MRLPRPLARAYAAIAGYFWLPCPICGRMFAGFEWDGRAWFEQGATGGGLGFCDRHPYRYLVRAPGGWLYEPVTVAGSTKIPYWPGEPSGLRLTAHMSDEELVADAISRDDGTRTPLEELRPRGGKGRSGVG